MEIASSVAVLLMLVVISSMVLSFYVMYRITGNGHASMYYSLSSIFDTNDEGYSALVLSAVQAYSVQFYELVAVLIIDGMVKAVVIAFGVAIIVGIITSLNIRSKLMSIANRRMSGHVVVCGYSALARDICEKLHGQGKRFVVIEKRPEKIEELLGEGYNFVEGDFTELEVMGRASAASASSIVLCAGDEFTNLLGVITARRINSRIRIISRARSEQAVSKMHRGGADLCIIPEVVAGIEIGNMMLGV